jgi:hypothetical protein
MNTVAYLIFGKLAGFLAMTLSGFVDNQSVTMSDQVDQRLPGMTARPIFIIYRDRGSGGPRRDYRPNLVAVKWIPAFPGMMG